MFNASLKSRIDEFVTENRIEIHSGTTTRDSDPEAIMIIFNWIHLKIKNLLTNNNSSDNIIPELGKHIVYTVK